MKTYANSHIRRKAVWGLKPALATFVAVTITLTGATAFAKGPHSPGHAGHPSNPNHFVDQNYKLDQELTRRSKNGSATHFSTVIVELKPGAQIPKDFQRFVRAFNLQLINGAVLELPDNLLKKLANYPDVFRVHDDRPIGTNNYRTGVTVGATTVRQTMGYTAPASASRSSTRVSRRGTTT